MDWTMHPVTLHFRDAVVERAFVDETAHKQQRPWRFFTFLTVALFIAAAAVDYSTLAFARSTPRFFLWLPWDTGLNLFVLLFTSCSPAIFARHWERVFFAYVTLFGLGFLWEQATFPAASTRLAFALVLGILAAFTFWGVRFVVVTASACILLVAYALVLALVPVPPEQANQNVAWLSFAVFLGIIIGRALDESRRRVFVQQRLLDEERAKSEGLLRNMLPASVAQQLKDRPAPIADGFEAVTVLFADIVGFTPLSAQMSPREVVALLNEMFSTFDALALRHGLEKIKTIGDAYMVVGGLPEIRSDHASAVASMALEMREAVARRGDGLALRIGLHTGPVVAGVIGTTKYSYDLWGDTVNTASRMESHGVAGEIHVSAACRDVLGARFEVEERGVVDIKGKGPMRTYWLKGEASPLPG
jgi:class 3 adenylate cyclase